MLMARRREKNIKYFEVVLKNLMSIFRSNALKT